MDPRVNSSLGSDPWPDPQLPALGKLIPSDHAPLLIDVDELGHPIDAGWEAAQGRITARVQG